MGDDCERLLDELDHYLHGELDEQGTASLHAHLGDCPPCLESADFQAQLKELIACKCKEPLPDGLREKVLGFLRDVEPS